MLNFEKNKQDPKKGRKTSFLSYVHLTKVLFYLKHSLKSEEKTRPNSHACQLNYNKRRLGKEIGSCTSKSNNIISICTTTFSAWSFERNISHDTKEILYVNTNFVGKKAFMK